MAQNAQHIINNAKRLVIKIGSSLLVSPNTDGANKAWLQGLARDIATLKARGCDVILVSSGAVAIGRQKLKLQSPLKLEEKQAAAAAGQVRLMNAYEQALAPFNMSTAQMLLTLSIAENRRFYLNARATLETLLGLNVIPIINENDTVATAEIRYGDNDRLAAHAAQMAGADALVLLSDVDGLFTANPNIDPKAKILPVVETITKDIEVLAGSAQDDGVGTGGMITKIEAARIAARAGCATIIMKGVHTDQGPFSALESGAASTLFKANGTPQTARKQWIASALQVEGAVVIDEGAITALKKGASLLPAGVIALEGDFHLGDMVEVQNQNGTKIAQGLISYDADEVVKVMGAKSDQVEKRLGYRKRPALIHRDDLMVF